MKTLIELMVKAVVDHAEAVCVTEGKKETPEPVTVYEVRVAGTDIGQVIGKEGRIADAIRTIARGVAMKQRQHVVVQVIQE